MSEKRILQMVAPSDPRLLTKIAPYQDDMLKEHDFENRKALADAMYDTMKKYGGIGLSCNQVGLPFRMFVMGGHPQIDLGRTRYCFNPQVLDMSKEMVMMKEGCLTFPFLFLNIKRPRKVVVKYEDENGDLKEGQLDGMFSRIFQHEMDHMLGINFTDKVTKFKLKRAEEKARKMYKVWLKQNEKANK